MIPSLFSAIYVTSIAYKLKSFLKKLSGVEMSIETTFCMIKPDSAKNKHVGGIINYLEKENFEFLQMIQMKLTNSFCEIFYKEHKEREFFSSLINFITSGPVIAMALRRENGCLYLREIMGSTNPKEATRSSIRALYGESIERNAIHGSDSLKSAKRELPLFFPKEVF